MLHEKILFEAKTLKEAYEQASLEYECSITNLKSEVIQTPSNGFLGLFKKNAIIKVLAIISDDNTLTENKTETNSSKIDPQIINAIQLKVNELFSSLCYDIDEIIVSSYDINTIKIHFTGNDCALLIGKEGYRYKAISYILFNWIHDKYNLMLRLEIAEFLSSQENNIKKYIESILPKIIEAEYYKTKTLDGILIHIALTILREKLPNKYICVKQNINKEKYILITEYKNK